MKIDFSHLATIAYSSQRNKYVDVDTADGIIQVAACSIFITPALYNLNSEYFDAMKFEEGEDTDETIWIPTSDAPIHKIFLDNDEWVIGDDYSFILHPYFAEQFFKDFNQMCDEYRRDRQ